MEYDIKLNILSKYRNDKDQILFYDNFLYSPRKF